MKYKILIPGILILCLFAVFLCQPAAQEEAPEPARLKLFSNQKRPVPEFDHDLHKEGFGETGCASVIMF